MSLKWYGDQIETALEQSVKTGVSKSLDVYEETIWDMISNRQKSGNVYNKTTRQASPGAQGQRFTLGGAERLHKASAPGEPFAYDFGEWWGSRMTRQNGLEGDFSVDTDYAAGLEFGTSKMAPRPTLRPALTESAPKIIDEITNSIKQVIK